MTRLLAQLGDFLNPDVAPLPPPPFLQRFVLEQPMVPAVVLVVLGVVALIVLRNADRARLGLVVASVAVVVAGGVVAAGSLVQTHRERLIERQDQLVEAVARGRTEEVDRLLAPDARVRGVDAPLLRDGLTRSEILSTVDRMLRSQIKIGTVGTIERQAVVDGPNAARTQVYVRVASDGAGSTWAWFLIGWRLGDDGQWLAIEIEPLFISGVLAYGS